MISKKYSQPLFMIFMSFGMSVIIMAVVTCSKYWFSDGFLKDILILDFAFPVALVAAFTMAPIMRPC